jgi:glycosyltransferase involved in cell wall biosynthesis
MKKIFYWSPYIGKIATVKAVLNSAISIKKFSNYQNEVSIINCFGEWNSYKKIFLKQKIKEIILQKKLKVNIKTNGFFNSRLIYILSFFYLYFNLKKTLVSKKPDILIIHLLTYIPLLLFINNRLKTKLYLRISGKPKLGILRKFLWKLASKNIHKIFCPTVETRNDLIKLKIFPKDKIFFLPDPIINEQFKFKKKIELIKKFKIRKMGYFLAIGRLSEQKNFELLINVFSKNFKNSKLYILGEGELRRELEKIIKQNWSKNIKLLGYKKNVVKYINKARAVIVPSLWEDPGFVMVETAFNLVPLIVSDCPSGPKEFIDKDKNGYLFNSNNEKSLITKINKFEKDKTTIVKKKIKNALDKSLNYTDINHYRLLKKFI